MSNARRARLAVIRTTCPVCARTLTATLDSRVPFHWPTYTQEASSADWCTGSLAEAKEGK